MSVSDSAGKPAVIVVMGVASSGKTSLGERLAERLGWPFRDADSFHPPENVAKMSSGTPLTDEDRRLSEYAMKVMALSKGIESTVARYRDAIGGDSP